MSLNAGTPIQHPVYALVRRNQSDDSPYFWGHDREQGHLGTSLWHGQSEGVCALHDSSWEATM